MDTNYLVGVHVAGLQVNNGKVDERMNEICEGIGRGAEWAHIVSHYVTIKVD